MTEENLTDKPKNVSGIFCVRCENLARGIIMVDSEPHCGDCLSIILEDLKAENRRLEGRLRLSAVEIEKLKMQLLEANERSFKIMEGSKKIHKEIEGRLKEEKKEKHD